MQIVESRLLDPTSGQVEDCECYLPCLVDESYVEKRKDILYCYLNTFKNSSHPSL